MNQPASKDPSMDDILSSIRQIISDDEPSAKEASPPAAEQQQMAAPPEVEVQDTQIAESEQMIASAPMVETVSEEISPEAQMEEMPLALSAEQMVEPAPDSTADEPLALSADQMLGDVEATEVQLEDVSVEEIAEDNGLMRAAPNPQEFEGEFGDNVSEDINMVVPDDIAFINDDDVETDLLVEVADLDDVSMVANNVDLSSLESDTATETYDFEESTTEPQSPLPDQSLTTQMSDELLEPATQAAAKSAFSQLDALTLSSNGQTVEDLIREMLRPLLKGWLDENLPSVVEQLVQREIERVSRGNK